MLSYIFHLRLSIILVTSFLFLSIPLLSQSRDSLDVAANANANGLFLVPSGFGPKKGELYYQNLTIFFNQVQYGASDQFSIGLTFELFSLLAAIDSNRYQPGFALSPKVSIPIIEEEVHLGLGAMFVEIPDSEEFLDLGFVLGTVTFGKEDRHVSAGLGFGLVEGDFSVQPIYLWSGQYRLSRRWHFMSENTWIPAAKLGLFNFGFRYRGRQVHWDLGLIIAGEKGKPFDQLPLLGLIVPIP